MDFLAYRQDHLYAENVAIAALADQYGTPLYVYSEKEITTQFAHYQRALRNRKHLICYAMKANSNLAVLSILAKLGAGFDIVSQGELERALKAGADPKKIVFSGVAKSAQEITRALIVGIKCFNVESEAELERINSLAKTLGKIAAISIRVNPDVDAKTHPYISTGLRENKFGISYGLALDVYRKAKSMPNIHIAGIDCHIGSQLTELSPFIDAAERILALVDKLKDEQISIEHIDLGGGLGVIYDNETPPSAEYLVQAMAKKLAKYPDIEIIFEPGRSIVANAGILITKVEYTKHQDELHFAIVDAGMNDLLRPALYHSWMKILPEKKPTPSDKPNIYHIVGPICESSDVLAKSRRLTIQQNDLLIICSAGAYGFSMASNYNSRPRPAEVMIQDSQHRLIRRRETLDELWLGETI